MAATDSTPLQNHVLNMVDLLDNMSHDTHKLEFLQDVLTLQSDGKMPENLNTTGLYFIMQDVIDSYRGIYKNLDNHRLNGADQGELQRDRYLEMLNSLADTVKTEFETMYLSLEGLLAVSEHSQISKLEINAVMNCMSKAKDSIRGHIDEACSI